VSVEVDPLSLQVFDNLFSSVAEEMGVTLQRASYSPNIKMRRDFSCALFDSQGLLLAQAAHIPVHLGAMPLAMEAARERFELQPGDTVIMNDPYTGGTHLPDVSLISGAFAAGGERLGYVMSRAHHADIGGMSPGSMPLSTEIFQEGVIIPPVLLVENDRVNKPLLELILRNVRTPDERRGDFDAQLAAQQVGATGMAALAARYGVGSFAAHGSALQSYSESMTRKLIEAIPPGHYDFADFLDDDGSGDDPVPIHVRITRYAGSSDLIVDFSGSSPQRPGSINAVTAVTTSAALYAMRCLVGEDIPVNQGSLVPLRVIAPPGSVVAADPPSAVAGGNVETSQRIVDVLFGALARALPGAAPAASQGTMNNLALGGRDSRRGGPFAYYETMGGGMGGRPETDGASAVHDHMSNTLNTPVEAVESELPVQVLRYEVLRGSGGAGAHTGGDGLRRDLRFLEPATVTILSERRRLAPYGLAGGLPGTRGENVLTHAGLEESLRGKATFSVAPGDVLSIRTPGGGGWGTLPDVATR
jgi:N-methylhydantoinase B